MEVRIKVSDKLAARAKALGLTVEDYIREILAQQVVLEPPNGARPRTPEEIRAWLDALAQFSDKIPALPETIARDWIYQDHS